MTEELKKKLFECLLELPQKKDELEQLQQHCHAEHLSKQEVLAENESLKVEVNTLRAQLNLTNKVLHKCEENYKDAKDVVVKHKLGLEATSLMGDKMKEEAVRLHNENMVLKKQIEQLEKEIKTETFYRESCMSKQTKMQTTIESLTNQMRNLEKDFKNVENKANTTVAIGNKNKLTLESKNHIIKQMQEKIESLSAQNISLTGEIKTLKMNESNIAVEQDYVQEIMKEWQISLNEIKNRKESYEKELESLYNTLEMALKDMRKFQVFEEQANERVRELESQLEEAKKKKKIMSTDCSVQTDLTMAIEVGCQTDMENMEGKNKETLTSHSHSDLQTEGKEVCGAKKLTESSYSSADGLKYSSNAVSELISRLQRERAKQQEETLSQLSQTVTVVDELQSEMPTQPNTMLVQK